MVGGDDRDFVLIAVNPRAGWQTRTSQLREIAERLRTHGLSVEILTDLTEVERIATKLHEQGRLRALVGAGGDGTLAELVNRTPPGTPTAIYPCGTANLVARYVGITQNVDVFSRLILDATTRPLDAGRANGRLFLAVCSCGFDAEVVRRLHLARSGNISSLAYLSPLAAAMSTYAFPPMNVSWGTDVQPSRLTARWAFVSNLPCYALGLRPGAGASGDDGLLDLCALKRGGYLSAMRYLPALWTGMQKDLPDCRLARANQFYIEPVDGDVPYELDGDPGGMLPVKIDILPNRVTLIVPRDRSLG